jgi:hypothetical protein
MHPVSAVGDAFKVARLTDDRHSCRRKANTHCGISSGDELAHPAPAKASRDWSSMRFVTDSAAQASTSDHGFTFRFRDNQPIAPG